MITYVLDASVVIKWFFEEPYRDAAKQYLDSRLTHIAPDLLIVECANAIRKKVVLKQLCQDDANDGFALFMRRQSDVFNILYSSKDLVHRAFALSIALKHHPLPDCLYLALAEKEHCRLVTADQKFYKLVQASDFYRFICWIEEPPLGT